MSRNRYTLFACYFGYITQAIINSLLPLLFVTLQHQFRLSVSQIGFMVSYNFIMQILVDLFAAKYADRIGYRRCMIWAHITAAVGIAGLGFFPFVLPDPYIGLLVCVTISAMGGGLIEALVGPIVQALPLERKESAIGILHSFYCWGHAGVVIFTTLFFQLAGTENWRLLCALWAVIPAAKEFGVSYMNLCKDLLALVGEVLPQPKSAVRRGSYIVYYKESENIEDMLTYIGAVLSSLEMMNIKIEKDIKNRVNRRMNCDNANMDKTLNASLSQVADIKYIFEQKSESFLPEELYQVAKLRLENPEMSLRELCESVEPPLSRSGMNHRLKKISEIANNIRNGKI